MEGRERERPGRVPVVDLIRCSNCEACLELCPEVFSRNSDTGGIQVADLSDYPEEAVNEVMAHCPKDCIAWEET